jgi:hypothetical protein
VLLASSDCSVSFNDLNGNLLGIFGQDSHWHIDSSQNSLTSSQNMISMSLNKIDKNADEEIGGELISDLNTASLLINDDVHMSTTSFNNADAQSLTSEREPLILPELNKKLKIETTFDFEKEAFIHDTALRYNPWSKTLLGKSYQETRVRKRDRKQPSLEKSEEFISWEKTGQCSGGLYGVSFKLLEFRY